MYDRKSGLTFLARIGLVPEYGTPWPAICPGALPVHDRPLQKPLPLGELSREHDGFPEPPEGGQTLQWPWLPST